MSSRARSGGRDRLVRSYVLTGGRSAPSRNHFDPITLVSLSDSAAHLSRSYLAPEPRAVLDLLRASAQSVAELGAHLDLPLSVLRILLADLMESGHITTHRPITQASSLDTQLLVDVLAGLLRL